MSDRLIICKQMEKPIYYAELVNYLANPYDNRTYEEFGASIGVSRNELWKARKAFKNELAEDVKKERQIALDAMRAQAWKALASKLKSDSNALKLFFQLSGDLVERVEQTTKYESVDQKREKLGNMLEKFGIKLIVSDTHSNGSQLPQDQLKTPPVPQLPNKTNNSL